ncbi:MAG: M48 family metallopeptidase [Pseudomonadota bacterium]
MNALRRKPGKPGLLLLALALMLAAAGLADRAGAFGLGDAGKLFETGKAAVKLGKAVGKASEELTAEHEYYIGRAVAASILASQRPWANQAANQYLNLLGQTLAEASDRPQTFGGYHFLVLDTPDINAFGCPGGLIMVSRGLLRCCQTEDQVAAVLAHEIGHVSLQHGLASIQQSRILDVAGILAKEGASHAGGNVAMLSGAFSGSVGDVTKTLVVNGYTRGQEGEADADALVILERLGYDPKALTQVLATMGQRYKPGGLDFAKTHPDPQDRITALDAKMPASAPAPPTPARQARYQQALGRI